MLDYSALVAQAVAAAHEEETKKAPQAVKIEEQAPEMIRFKTGEFYFDRAAGDHNIIYVIKVVKRSAKMITYIDDDGRTRRAKIETNDRGVEWISQGRYSMAPVFSADSNAREELERIAESWKANMAVYITDRKNTRAREAYMEAQRQHQYLNNKVNRM